MVCTGSKIHHMICEVYLIVWLPDPDKLKSSKICMSLCLDVFCQCSHNRFQRCSVWTGPGSENSKTQCMGKWVPVETNVHLHVYTTHVHLYYNNVVCIMCFKLMLGVDLHHILIHVTASLLISPLHVHFSLPLLLKTSSSIFPCCKRLHTELHL